MDKKVEDKMVKQIEKNLSNNLNESLFLTGRLYDNEQLADRLLLVGTKEDLPQVSMSQDQPIVSFDYSNPESISRAEYIRQARESCLRQLSTVQSTARTYDSYYLDTQYHDTIPQMMEPIEAGKAKSLSLFHNDTQKQADDDAETQQEVMAFRLLVLRMVCAIVIFLSVFLMDRFDIKLGKVSVDTIQEYVTGKDAFEELENKFVTWLRKED